MKTTYKTDFELLREEISKDIIDKKHCHELIYSLEYDKNQIDNEIYDLEGELSDLKQDVRYMESEIESLNRNNKPSPPSMLDSYYKSKVFIELSEKYTWYQLEDILKNNNII